MSYPLGINNPIIVKGVIGTHKFAIYWRDDLTKIATFNSEHQAYQARRQLLDIYKQPWIKHNLSVLLEKLRRWMLDLI